MIPIFLDEFKSEIEKYKLETVRISAMKIAGDEILSLEQSKFLGKPILPLDYKYPRTKDGTPMIMLAQINFGEVPSLDIYPTEGILQLFVSPTEWYDIERL